MIVIDATDLIIGRMASYIAKQLLLGETIHVVNCEKAVITGSKKQLISEYVRKREMGTPRKGPFFHRMPHKLVKRIIRGMLPYKRERGKDAFKRLRCYVRVPDALKNEKLVTVKEAHISKLPSLKYLDLKTISKTIGAKIE